MGNCIRKESATEWGGDDWGSFGSGQEKTRMDEGGLSACNKSNLLGTEVKIKISKKELEKLMKEADVEGVSLQQILAQLVSGGGAVAEPQSRPWSPALHSIPE